MRRGSGTGAAFASTSSRTACCHAAHALMVRSFPQLVERLREHGGLEINLAHAYVDLIPQSSHRPDDDRFVTVTARRPTFDWLWATALAEEPAIAVYRGVPAVGLLRGTDVVAGVAHVVGVRLADGTELHADLVVDAGGRGSPVADLLLDIGAPRPATVEHDSGFAYTGRYYRSRDGSLPEFRAPVITPMGSISVLTLPADRVTWSVTLYARADDRAVRPIRRPASSAAWCVRARCMRTGSTASRSATSPRCTASPIATVASSSTACRSPPGSSPSATPSGCTDPSLGRGMTMALMHTDVLCDVLREHDVANAQLAVAFEEATQAVLGPWYDATVQNGHLRIAEMGAAARGEPFAPEGPAAVAMALAHAKSVDEGAAGWSVRRTALLLDDASGAVQPAWGAPACHRDRRQRRPPAATRPRPRRAPRPRGLTPPGWTPSRKTRGQPPETIQRIRNTNGATVKQPITTRRPVDPQRPRSPGRCSRETTVAFTAAEGRGVLRRRA